MSYSDKALGVLLLSTSAIIFVYYSAWIFLVPFIETGHPILNFFFPLEYAIAIPATLLIGFVVVVGMFIGVVLSQEAIKKKKK